jgi:anti-sigma B factor antagonist
MSLQCTNTSEGRFALSGELDIYNANEAKAVMCDIVSHQDAEVDLSQITEIDFVGVQVLLAAKHEAESNHGALHLNDPSPAVSDALELLGVESVVVLPREAYES